MRAIGKWGKSGPFCPGSPMSYSLHDKYYTLTLIYIGGGGQICPPGSFFYSSKNGWS